MRGLDVKHNTNGFTAVRLHYTADPAKTPAWVAANKPKVADWQWEQEEEINWSARGGRRIYDMWDSNVHEIVLGDMPDTWTRYGCLDHGLANPTAHLWGAVDTEHNLRIYMEYYQSERTIAMNCEAILAMQGPVDVPRVVWGDPSLAQRDPQTGTANIDEYARNGVVITPANNRLGFSPVIDRLIAALAKWSVEHDEAHPHFCKEGEPCWETIREWAMKPAIWFSRACEDTIQEHREIRWKEVVGNPEDHNRKEDAQDVDDHAVDAIRYLCGANPRYVAPRANEVRYEREAMVGRTGW